jgi:diguanylate cyclase (GGDEF)-like protein
MRDRQGQSGLQSRAQSDDEELRRASWAPKALGRMTLVSHRQDAEPRSARTWSLRREWARAFAIMLALLLVAAAMTVVGLRGVVNDVQSTAHQLRRESVAVAALRTDLVAHEEVGHKLLSDEPVNRQGYVADQQRISREFAATESVFPTSNGMRATVLAAQRSWVKGLMTYRLWSTELPTLRGSHEADNPTFGASSDSTDAQLDSLQGPSLTAMNNGLAHGADLERALIVALIVWFGLAVIVTAYFRRRMIKDLMRPVAILHEGVVSLQAGDYDHRIEVVRRDELGALADAFNDMATAVHDSHRSLTHRASHDSLTGLPNRASLAERLATSFAPNADRRSIQESVLFIDIDDFKHVNDSLGHQGGDELLTEMVTRLTSCVRPYDMLARLGGDEFAIVVADTDGVSAAVVVAERILDAMRVPFVIGETSLMVSVSIGIAPRRPETTDAAELLRQADFAMYTAKGGGKSRYDIFDSRIHDTMADRSALKTDLAAAVALGQLRLEYQPVADLRTGEILGVEALVRWQHPTLGLLAPAEFIALAEETGDIDALGCWVLDTAARQAAVWRGTIPLCNDLWVSVNLSPFQLPNPHSLSAIQHILADPNVQAHHVVLEVTETALMADIDGGAASLNSLKHLGVRIAIDDFGTGFSSLSTLNKLPVDIVKIDRTFVSGDPTGAPSVPLLEGILGLAHKLGLTVIAEGIERPEQLEMLRTLGCPMGQGFLLDRPVPPHILAAKLASGGLVHIETHPDSATSPTAPASPATRAPTPI